MINLKKKRKGKIEIKIWKKNCIQVGRTRAKNFLLYGEFSLKLHKRLFSLRKGNSPRIAKRSHARDSIIVCYCCRFYKTL